MNQNDIAQARLANQRLTATTFTTAAEVVAWLVAVQAQEVARAKAALGLRARGLDEAAVERAFAAGEILRTHVLRPTWHFVAPADIRWLLKLTAPRVHQVNGSSAEDGARLGTMGNALQNVIVLDGRIVGTWRRTLGKDTLGVELNPFRALSAAEGAAIVVAQEQLVEFYGLRSDSSLTSVTTSSTGHSL